MGMPPSVAGVRLAIAPLQATKKHPSHSLRTRFPTDCCAKNTQFGRTLVTIARHHGPRRFIKVINRLIGTIGGRSDRHGRKTARSRQALPPNRVQAPGLHAQPQDTALRTVLPLFNQFRGENAESRGGDSLGRLGTAGRPIRVTNGPTSRRRLGTAPPRDATPRPPARGGGSRPTGGVPRETSCLRSGALVPGGVPPPGR
jgi:hypothetical protein